MTIYILNHNSLSHQLGQMINTSKGNNFQESLGNLEDWGYVPDPFQLTNLLQLLNNQLCRLFSASFFDRMNKGKLKMVNKSDNIEILLKPWKGLELVFSLQHWTKKMLVKSLTKLTNTWPNFILIICRIQKK